MKIRLRFSKQGQMKFIGHLDMVRYFQKVMRRSEVDVAYSEGFSPHQKMSFAAPLSVGVLSRGEYFDLEVNSTESSKVMLERINTQNVEGVEVLSYKLLPDDAKNAMSVVAGADYKVYTDLFNHIYQSFRFFYTSFLSILPHSHTFAKAHGKYLQTLSGKFSQNQSIVTLLGHADTPLIDKKKKRTVF